MLCYDNGCYSNGCNGDGYYGNGCYSSILEHGSGYYYMAAATIDHWVQSDYWLLQLSLYGDLD